MGDQNILLKSELLDALRTGRDEVVGIVRSLSAERARLVNTPSRSVPVGGGQELPRPNRWLIPPASVVPGSPIVGLVGHPGPRSNWRKAADDLPAPQPHGLAQLIDSIPRLWGGAGNGETCDACEETITKTQFVMEDVSTTRGKGIQFHVGCPHLWDAEQQRARPR